jgi:hypothetical protein
MGWCGWQRSDETPLGDTGPPGGDRTIVERHLARAEEGLVVATGGASLCRVGDGPQVGSVKYAEGRYAAMRELRPQLRFPDSVALAAAVGLLASWQAARARAESQGPAWTAYRDGGVAALRGLVDDVTTEGALP